MSAVHTPIGGHVPVAGGLATGGLKYAERIGAEVIQVFVGNPRGWAMPGGKPEEDARLRESGVPVFVHANYLINPGSPNPETLEKSLAAIRHALRRGHQIGAGGVVIHTGSSVSQSYEQAMRQIHERLLPVLEEIGEDGPPLLLEPMAGQSNMLCATVQQLGPYFEALEHHPKLGVCLDTCHAWAAGHDLTAPGGVKETMDALVATVGPGRLKLIHANDSKDPCGSCRDRHENIGAGHIGEAPFAELLRHPAAAGVPFVIETPGRDPEPHRKDIETLKRLRDASRTA
ncbi:MULTISPECIES: deoxyribonuclease IV [Thermomonospora]|uniref:Probable endonuclease 4 n=1 Tax=Thermomonospora curvata (strain ATCC 19995 / DSM 43183 / JCM 3096 / KCTC 9072 / NBRC 15933 / NCIMB 10081 / Henssen B9) TaxID=471852 RepID=D1A8U1_THECD|nr:MULTISPECIES: deoxyribonuclease IV [Thermomonospora]ACY98579.1 apurinic endonuclease Apn1 [Thermomonospora curvata DSM 43183]PKK13716.1 MAG: deoxyribonuclease IV [Thermomonospora sp. CIF 1]